MTESDNFMENTQRFMDEVKRAIYDNYINKVYTSGSTAITGALPVEGFNESTLSLPEMHYRHITLAEALEANSIDILLLFLFNILFFSVAFIRFRRYDVR